jgi:hypothetical protein
LSKTKKTLKKSEFVQVNGEKAPKLTKFSPGFVIKMNKKMLDEQNTFIF